MTLLLKGGLKMAERDTLDHLVNSQAQQLETLKAQLIALHSTTVTAEQRTWHN